MKGAVDPMARLGGVSSDVLGRDNIEEESGRWENGVEIGVVCVYAVFKMAGLLDAVISAWGRKSTTSHDLDDDLV